MSKTKSFELSSGKTLVLEEAWAGDIKQGALWWAQMGVDAAAHFFGCPAVDPQSITFFDDRLDGTQVDGMTDGRGNVWVPARLWPQDLYKVSLHEGYHRVQRLLGADPFTGTEEAEATYFEANWDKLRTAMHEVYDVATGRTRHVVDDTLLAQLLPTPRSAAPAPQRRATTPAPTRRSVAPALVQARSSQRGGDALPTDWQRYVHFPHYSYASQ